MAQAPKNITPLSEILSKAASTKLAELSSAPNVALKDEKELTLMRTHLLDHYKGVESQHSFVDANGSIFDCIPVEQQASLRGKPAPGAAPELPAAAATSEHTVSAEALKRLPASEHDIKQAVSFLQSGGNDVHGNAYSVPDGTIPVRRITLEEMSRYQTLRHFFSKNPVGAETVPPTAQPAVAATHRWAHATQGVANVGGHSRMNIWQPVIGANQIFSLSQHWYVGSSAAGATQTVEVGLQVYPGKYNRAQPTFFIYWTADGYNKTGCYNLDCSAFVQTNKSWAIGGAVGPISTYAGAQYELEIAAHLIAGKWWIYVNGAAIGYYPASQYGTGTLSTHSTLIDFGGETVGTTTFPGMGSSHFAAEGWTKACYQRQIQYYPQAGGTVDASLTAQQQWPGCYTAIVDKYNPIWSETLWYGGPGGNC